MIVSYCCRPSLIYVVLCVFTKMQGWVQIIFVLCLPIVMTNKLNGTGGYFQFTGKDPSACHFFLLFWYIGRQIIFGNYGYCWGTYFQQDFLFSHLSSGTILQTCLYVSVPCTMRLCVFPLSPLSGLCVLCWVP